MKNPATVIKDLAVDLAGRLARARSALDDVTTTDKEFRHEHAALVAERARLVGSAPPRGELIAKAEGDVDATATAVAAEPGPRLVAALAGYVDLAPDGTVRGVVAGSLGPALAGQDPAPLLGALFPDQVKAGLRCVLNATEYAEGPSMGERPRLIAEVDGKLRDVEEQHTRFVDQAPPGIMLELLPAVRAQHAKAKHLAEWRARQERDAQSRIR